MLEDKYLKTKDFRVWVIETAVNEINEKSPIKVKYELEKTGRKYTHLLLEFELKDKNKNNKQQGNSNNLIVFKSDKQRYSFANKLSRLPELADRATGSAGRSYEEFAEQIANELLDPKNHEFYKPHLEKLGFVG